MFSVICNDNSHEMNGPPSEFLVKHGALHS
jgi:hypothetical protein